MKVRASMTDPLDVQSLFANVKTTSWITLLRKRFPGRWTYDRQARIWEHESGWHVYRCGVLTIRYDGDDNTSIEFRRSDTGERLW